VPRHIGVNADVAVLADENQDTVRIWEESYVQMPYPGDEAIRYTTLMSEVKNLIPFATHFVNLYKRMRLALAHLYNTRNSHNSAQSVPETNSLMITEVLPPESAQNIRKRISEKDVSNQSRLVKIKFGGCKDCRAAKLVQTDKHRAKSSKYPLQ